MHFDDILKQYLGEFGRYQKIQYVLVCLPTIFTGLHALSWSFTGFNMKHRCMYPGENSSNVNYTILDTTNLYQVHDLVPKDKKSCYRVANYTFDNQPPYNNASISLERCPDSTVWDRSLRDDSAVKEWGLICEYGILRAVIQGMYYIGQFLGSFILGPLSDKIGRKKVFFLSILIQIACGGIMAYVPWWPVFAIMRMGVGFAHPGIFIIAVVIGMELVGPSKRMLGGIASGFFFSLGQIILGALAFGVKDFRNFQLTISLPALIFISYWWLVPESARWLLSRRRFVEADAILQRAARVNNRTLPPNWYEQIDIDQKKPTATEAKSGIKGMALAYASLFKTPSIRRRSILTAFICWPAVSMVYYGLAMNPSFLSGDEKMREGFIVGGILEAPALLVVLLTINIVGRKFLCMAGFLLAALALTISMIIYWSVPEAAADKTSGYNMALVILVVFGKSCLTGTYAVLYIFTPELFPTTVRSTAMGMCSMIARIGSYSASYVSMYLADRDKVAACWIFLTLATLGGFACLGLPETAGTPMLETITEAERFGKDMPMFKFMRRPATAKGAEDEKAQELLVQTPSPADPHAAKEVAA